VHMSMHVGYDLGGGALKAAAGWGTRAVGERGVTRGGAPTSLEGLPGEDTSLGGSVVAAREGVSACASGALVMVLPLASSLTCDASVRGHSPNCQCPHVSPATEAPKTLKRTWPVAGPTDCFEDWAADFRPPAGSADEAEAEAPGGWRVVAVFKVKSWPMM
jgi:hypothetical protein